MKRFFSFVILYAILMLPSVALAQQNAQAQQAQAQPTTVNASIGFTEFVTSSFINYYATGGVQGQGVSECPPVFKK